MDRKRVREDVAGGRSSLWWMSWKDGQYLSIWSSSHYSPMTHFGKEMVIVGMGRVSEESPAWTVSEKTLKSTMTFCGKDIVGRESVDRGREGEGKIDDTICLMMNRKLNQYPQAWQGHRRHPM